MGESEEIRLNPSMNWSMLSEQVHQYRKGERARERDASSAIAVAELARIQVSQYRNKEGEQHEQELQERDGESQRQESELDNPEQSHKRSEIHGGLLQTDWLVLCHVRWFNLCMQKYVFSLVVGMKNPKKTCFR